MVDPTRSDRTRAVGEPTAPERADNIGLMEHLADVQARTRRIMGEFNIGSAHICLMARHAEQTISDTALRAEFLRLLIDLHEFGGEAKRRGLLGRPASEPAASGERAHLVLDGQVTGHEQVPHVEAQPELVAPWPRRCCHREIGWRN